MVRAAAAELLWRVPAWHQPARRRKLLAPAAIVLLMLLTGEMTQLADAAVTQVADTKFSVGRGWYSAPFDVVISTETPGATIRYTTDGTEPSESHGTIATGAVRITGSTTLRAMAYRDGWTSTNVDTQTYLFSEDVLAQGEVGPAGRFWSTGLSPSLAATYTDDEKREALEALPSLVLTFPSSDAWFGSAGPHWDTNLELDIEVPAAVEMLYPRPAWSARRHRNWNARAGASLTGGGKMRRDGGGRTHKLSVSLAFRAALGTAKLKEQVFAGSATASAYAPEAGRYNRLLLNAGFEDAWTRANRADAPTHATLMRNAWAQATLAAMDDQGVGIRGMHVHLFMHGLYWGVYHVTERADEAFASSYSTRRLEREAFFASKNDPEPTDPTNAVYDEVGAVVAFSSNYEYVKQRLDTAALIDWKLLQWYAAVGTEIKWYSTTEIQPVGVTRYYPRDIESLLVAEDGAGTAARYLDYPSDESTSLTSNLLAAAPEFREHLIDRVYQHCLTKGGALTDQIALARWDALADALSPAIVTEGLRWSDEAWPLATLTREGAWNAAVADVRARINGNAAALVAQLQAQSLYPSFEPPSLALGARTLRAPAGATSIAVTLSAATTASGAAPFYFTTSLHADPRQPGSTHVTSAAHVVHLSVPGRVAARTFLPGKDAWTDWSALAQLHVYPTQDLGAALRLTEVLYRPLNELEGVDGHGQQFIEFKNVGDATVDLSGVRFLSGVACTVPWGTTVSPGSFLVLVRDPAGFQARYPGVAYHGTFAGRLPSHATLALVEHDDHPITSISYSEDDPWPRLAARDGHSLVPTSATPPRSQDDPSLWRASAAPGGSPGADDPYHAPPNLLAMLLWVLLALALGITLTIGLTRMYLRHKDAEAAEYEAAYHQAREEKRARKAAKKQAREEAAAAEAAAAAATAHEYTTAALAQGRSGRSDSVCSSVSGASVNAAAAGSSADVRRRGSNSSNESGDDESDPGARADQQRRWRMAQASSTMAVAPRRRPQRSGHRRQSTLSRSSTCSSSSGGGGSGGGKGERRFSIGGTSLGSRASHLVARVTHPRRGSVSKATVEEQAYARETRFYSHAMSVESEEEGNAHMVMSAADTLMAGSMASEASSDDGEKITDVFPVSGAEGGTVAFDTPASDNSSTASARRRRQRRGDKVQRRSKTPWPKDASKMAEEAARRTVAKASRSPSVRFRDQVGIPAAGVRSSDTAAARAPVPLAPRQRASASPASLAAAWEAETVVPQRSDAVIEDEAAADDADAVDVRDASAKRRLRLASMIPTGEQVAAVDRALAAPRRRRQRKQELGAEPQQENIKPRQQDDMDADQAHEDTKTQPIAAKKKMKQPKQKQKPRKPVASADGTEPRTEPQRKPLIRRGAAAASAAAAAAAANAAPATLLPSHESRPSVRMAAVKKQQNPGKPSFLVYHLVISNTGKAGEVQLARRYNQFRSLAEALHKDNITVPEFPDKQCLADLLGPSASARAANEQRTRMLPIWLQRVLRHPDAAEHRVVRRFIDPRWGNAPAAVATEPLQRRQAGAMAT